MDEELTPETIAQSAAGAQSFTVDGESGSQVPIKDQILAAQFKAANQSSVRRRPLRGIRFVPVIQSDC